MRHHDLEQHLHDAENHLHHAGKRAGKRARQYVDEMADNARAFGRHDHGPDGRFARHEHAYRRRFNHAAEDLADEANYHYHRLRRQVNRHPLATVAIVAGTVGAFVLLRRAFRGD